MPTLFEKYRDEDIAIEAEEYAGRIVQIMDQRVKQLANLAQQQSSEKANVDGFLDALDDSTQSGTDQYSQIKSENRVKLRSIAKKQWRNKEIQQLSLYVTRGGTNQADTEAELLDRLIEQIAADTGSNFATLVAAITAANAARQ